MLSNIGKDAGATAAETLRKAVSDAAAGVQGAIESAKSAGISIEDHGILGLYGIVVAIRNTLNGAEVPIDLTFTVTARLTGKVGPAKLTVPEEQADPQVVTVT